MDLVTTASDALADPVVQCLVERVRHAVAHHSPLRIRGGGTKDFYGQALEGEVLDVSALRGITSHEPSELVVTARAGTPLAELEAALAAHGQHLAFEPPRFGAGGTAQGTVGGMVAAGLSGPARASAGAVRDHILGATVLGGQGEVMAFGGQVMKNVAGYDVSRLMAGAMGTLGVLLEVSLKVMPMAPATLTLRFEMDQAQALERLRTWAGQPLPLHASAWWEGLLVLRLSGARAAVEAAHQTLGGEVIEPTLAQAFWQGLRDHRDEFFVKAQAAAAASATLWRLSVPDTAPVLPLSGEQLVEWGGAQRWVCTGMPAAAVRQAALEVGGHATLFRGRDKSAGVFTPLQAPLDRLHRELKRSFDPAGIFNPGRLYPDF